MLNPTSLNLTNTPAAEPISPQPRLGEYLIAQNLLKPEDLAWVLELQQHTHEPLGQILISRGLLRRFDLYQALAELWGLPFIDLLATPPQADLVTRFTPEMLIENQFMPVRRQADTLDIAVARQPDAAIEALVRQGLADDESQLNFLITSDWDIHQAIRQVFRQELLDGAIYGLYYRKPEESAYTVFTRWQFACLALLCLALWLGLWFFPLATLITLNTLINLFFLLNVVFKFALSLAGASFEQWEAVSDDEIKALKDEELPFYTVLVPVYKEANVIGNLMRSLEKLDYPLEKVEILVLIEEDDQETLVAAKAARPPGNVYLVIIPNQIPKTKPKACNVGLTFARGEYLVIFDAEDRPDPDQLKKAVAAFRKGPPNLACVQAALNYFNGQENFFTRMFTLEYSYWFDYMLPGLYHLGLPIPLGGTSNHFRTDFLRKLGGWDPFNVTEDADLGMRASAEGYSVGIINSTTYEEANTHAGNWIRQRSRWIKGYMQTALVHLRAPWRLIPQLGWVQTLGFFFLIAGTPLMFLAMPILWLTFIFWLVTGLRWFEPLFPAPILYMSLINLLVGNGLAIYLNMLAGFKRGYYSLIPWAILNPFYWIFHSIAAYKALHQLFVRPFFWEKTVHGLSKDLHTAPK